MKFNLLAICVLCSFQITIAQDWANLERFQQANDIVMADKTDSTRVVFMGNSITQDWSEYYPEFFIGKNYINRGISGQTTSQILLRFRQDVITLNPRVVVILAGINDIAENNGPIPIEAIADNIKSMAELARAHHIEVILCSVLPADDFPWRKGLEPAEKIVKLNRLMESYAQEQRFEYADYFTAMADSKNALKSELGYDGVHPNKMGYILMESIIQPIILKVLQKK